MLKIGWSANLFPQQTLDLSDQKEIMMKYSFQNYKTLRYPLPEKTLLWNMYGAGLENIGVNGKPEIESIPEPADDQLLVRVDAVGMCFSDVKLINQGSAHPKLYNRNLKEEPTRVGHEATLTVIKVGKKLLEQFSPGERLVLQPDIYENNRSTAYGYTIPGGLIQYHLIGDEILNADAGSYVIPVGEEDMSYAEAALTEPWACVVASYTQRRRLSPKIGGMMWILGAPGNERQYDFSVGLDAPAKIVLSNTSTEFKRLVMEKKSPETEVIELHDLSPQQFQSLNEQVCNGDGFDDIVALGLGSSELITEAVKLIGFRGTFNLVGDQPLDGPVLIDAGRIHYHYTAYLGNNGLDISASYGEAHNRCQLKQHGTLVVVGAGGPMGQMHVQLAMEMKDGPKRIIASDVDHVRLSALKEFTKHIAEEKGIELLLFNPIESKQSLRELILEINDGQLADDVVVCVPSGPLMADSYQLLGPNGMFVLFAGVPVGTTINVEINDIFLNNRQLTGTSGSTLEDQRLVIERTLDGQLSPILSVAAIGGMDAAVNGLDAMMTGKYAGKVIIFPQIAEFPLTGLNDLAENYPEIAEKLGTNNSWTFEAEKALIEHFWRPE